MPWCPLVVGKGAVSFGRKRKAVSQQTETCQTPVQGVVAACGTSYPQGIAPWSASERCASGSGWATPMLRQMFEARPATARHPPQRWNYPQGIALLASMGVHFTALSVGSLAGEQIAQPLDVLPGDFWWHRLTLRLGW